MAESYDELKKENERVKQEREKDRKIIIAMKEQIDKLKKIIQAKTTDERWEDKEKEQIVEIVREQSQELVTTKSEVDSLKEIIQ